MGVNKYNLLRYWQHPLTLEFFHTHLTSDTWPNLSITVHVTLYITVLWALNFCWFFAHPYTTFYRRGGGGGRFQFKCCRTQTNNVHSLFCPVRKGWITLYCVWGRQHKLWTASYCDGAFHSSFACQNTCESTYVWLKSPPRERLWEYRHLTALVSLIP